MNDPEISLRKVPPPFCAKGRRYLFVFLFSLTTYHLPLTTVANAAIAIDAVTPHVQALDTSISWSHTVAAGSDRLLLVNCSFWHNDNAVVMSAVTYNGDALTPVGAIVRPVSGDSVEIWRLIAPATGANTVAFTYTNGGAAASCASISLTGVDQTTPLGAFASATGNSTTPSVNVSSASGDLVIDTVASFLGGGDPDASQLEQWDLSNADLEEGLGSTETATGATTTMSWTIGSTTWAIGGVAVKPAAGSGAAATDGIFFGTHF